MISLYTIYMPILGHGALPIVREEAGVCLRTYGYPALLVLPWFQSSSCVMTDTAVMHLLVPTGRPESPDSGP